jgi:uncharacterized protein (DUF1800 family)
MIHDEELFFARRLGYGLKQGETISGGVRDWAIKQISEVPPLDFYGPDGTNIRDHFPDYAEPVADFSNATRLWGEYANKETDLQKQVGKMEAGVWEKKIDAEIYRPRTDYPVWRDCLVRSLTAVNGPSPVFERFWSFWVNHFAVNANSFTKLFYAPHTRAIRARMTGKFADMLHDAILNPAMLYYLDNWLSTGPHSPTGLDGKETINENLARELLELHTMSPAAGYTQDDVIQTAFALSGWSFYGGERNQRDIPKSSPYGTYFNPHRHEPGTRKILGKTYDKGGKNGSGQAPALILDLATRPETAQFLSKKLVRHFIADDPPDDSAANIANAWIDSGGDMVTIHTAVIDEVIKKAPDNSKFLNPETWLYQAHRTTGVGVPETAIWDYGDDSKYWVNAVVEELGQPYGEPLQPNGWSDLQADWISNVLMERRVRYAFQLGKQVKDPAVVDFLRDFATRLSGANSALDVAMKDSQRIEAVVVLLSSPEFLRT